MAGVELVIEEKKEDSVDRQKVLKHIIFSKHETTYQLLYQRLGLPIFTPRVCVYNWSSLQNNRLQ